MSDNKFKKMHQKCKSRVKGNKFKFKNKNKYNKKNYKPILNIEREKLKLSTQDELMKNNSEKYYYSKDLNDMKRNINLNNPLIKKGKEIQAQKKSGKQILIFI